MTACGFSNHFSSHSWSFACVTPFKSGPSSLPPPIVWHAAQFCLKNDSASCWARASRGVMKASPNASASTGTAFATCRYLRSHSLTVILRQFRSLLADFYHLVEQPGPFRLRQPLDPQAQPVATDRVLVNQLQVCHCRLVLHVAPRIAPGEFCDFSYAAENSIMFVQQALAVCLAEKRLERRVKIEFLKFEVRADQVLRFAENLPNPGNISRADGLTQREQCVHYFLVVTMELLDQIHCFLLWSFNPAGETAG